MHAITDIKLILTLKNTIEVIYTLIYMSLPLAASRNVKERQIH